VHEHTHLLSRRQDDLWQLVVHLHKRYKINPLHQTTQNSYTPTIRGAQENINP